MSLRDVLGIVDGKNVPEDQHPLWTLLGPSTQAGSTMIPSRLHHTIPQMNVKDKTATSLRLLLCDAQSTFEGFASQMQGLVKDIGRATAQMEETTKLVDDNQTAATGDLKIIRKLAR